MKKLLSVVFLLIPGLVMASEGGVPLDKALVDLHNMESLKNGAKSFATYCMGCHSADYMRYNRIGRDLGMTPAEVDGLITTRSESGDKTKSGQLMKIAMQPEYAKQAFGTKVPDLTVIARARGADYLYTYLRTFYIDDSRPSGMNNIAFKDVAMPHVLWELQGLQKANFKDEKDAEGNDHKVFENMEIVVPGKMSPKEYDKFVGDLVNFLVYLGEPVQTERKSMGKWVLLYLAIFGVIAYLLKKEYWKDVH